MKKNLATILQLRTSVSSLNKSLSLQPAVITKEPKINISTSSCFYCYASRSHQSQNEWRREDDIYLADCVSFGVNRGSLNRKRYGQYDWRKNNNNKAMISLLVKQPHHKLSEITSNPISFFKYSKMSQNSYSTLLILTSCIKTLGSNSLKKDMLLSLINDVYFHINKNLNFQLPKSTNELTFLANAAYHLRSIDRPYYAELSHRWLHDIVMNVIYPRALEGLLDADTTYLACRCLTGLPGKQHYFGDNTDLPGFSEETYLQRCELIRLIFQYVQNNYEYLVHEQNFKIVHFFHMLYRQKYNVTQFSELQFLRRAILNLLEINNYNNHHVILKVDRLYGLLPAEFFTHVLHEITNESGSVQSSTKFTIDSLMRICYLLGEKTYVRQNTSLFDFLIEDILRNFTADSKSKYVSMLLKACLKANHKPPDVVVRKLCILFGLSMHASAYTEQLTNITQALIGLNMVHLGEDLVCKLIEMVTLESTNEQKNKNKSKNLIPVELIKSLEIEHGHLLERYMDRKQLDIAIAMRKSGSLLSETVSTYSRIGFASFYNSLLETAIGKGNITGTRTLPFFADIDHVFMIDLEGNILPSYEIRQTSELLPDKYLKTRSFEQSNIPVESNNTGIKDEQPVVSQNDILFSLTDSKDRVKKTWSPKEGHLIYLMLCYRDDTGKMFGVCEWQRRLVSLIRPKLNTFEIDHSYVSHVCEMTVKQQEQTTNQQREDHDSKKDNEDDEEEHSRMKLKEECVDYMKQIINYAIEQTLLKHSEKNQTFCSKENINTKINSNHDKLDRTDSKISIEDTCSQ